MRHSIVQPYYSLWNNMTIFDPKYYDPSKAMRVDPATGNPIAGSGDPYNGIVIPGNSWPDAAKGRVPIATTGRIRQPVPRRQGAALLFRHRLRRTSSRASASPTSSIRRRSSARGAGKFTTRLGVSDSIFLGGNPPLQPLASVPNGVVDNPGGGSLASFPLSVNTQAQGVPHAAVVHLEPDGGA